MLTPKLIFDIARKNPIAHVGAVNDYAVYVLENCSKLSTVYHHGSKVSQMEALRVFPSIASHLLFRE
jgi:hypothetical protein